MTPSTTTSAATPTITPPVAISVLSERKAPFRRDWR